MEVKSNSDVKIVGYAILNNKIRKLKYYKFCDMSRVLSYYITIAEQKYHKLQPIFLSKRYIKLKLLFHLTFL
jgi:hypothetical protein